MLRLSVAQQPTVAVSAAGKSCQNGVSACCSRADSPRLLARLPPSRTAQTNTASPPPSSSGADKRSSSLDALDAAQDDGDLNQPEEANAIQSAAMSYVDQVRCSSRVGARSGPHNGLAETSVVSSTTSAVVVRCRARAQRPRISVRLRACS
jgi:hypothetical protein